MQSRLEVTESLSDKIFLGSNVGELETGDMPANITRVNLSVDSDHYYTAGDDTGRAIEVTCPWGSQEMANSILASVSGKTYQPYTAMDALLDPAAEIGDAVTLGGYYSVIADISTSFDRASAPTISAPGSDEIDDEYPYESRERRETNRQLAQTRSLISKTSEEILLQVENELEGLSSSFSVQLKQIQSQVTGLDGQISTITQKVDNITLDVTNGSTSSSISLSVGGVVVSSQNIQMNGLVTFTGLANGTTTIDGACIKTGTIEADRLALTGEITWSDLASDAQNQVTNAQNLASSAYGTAVSAQTSANTANSQLSAWTYPGSTMINGNMLMTGTVMATQLLGGYVGLLNQYQQDVGNMTIGVATTGYAVELNSSGGLRLSSSGNFWVDSSYGTLGITASGVISGGNCVPEAGSRYSLGAPGLNWTQVYADNSTIVTSDRNKKTDITYDMSQYSALFDLLKPTPYKLAGGTSGRVHLGLISQDVENELSEVGLSSLEFAGFIKSTTEDGDLYALRYEEFIPLLIYEVQKLKKRVAELEAA